MPRTPPSLLWHAHTISPHLPPLLRATGDLPAAKAELRWLKAHALRLTTSRRPSHPGWRTLLSHYSRQRSDGKPLQYILGTQPFGELDVLCRPGVLIPRRETESITHHLSTLLARPIHSKSLKILDLCTGTGCIPLLLYAALAPRAVKVKGVDISAGAVRLARRNARHNLRLGGLPSRAMQDVVFETGDVLKLDLEGGWDVVTANPPYVSASGYERETGRSVRMWEPRRALVPDTPLDGGGDVFYGPILQIAQRANAKVVMMEVAGMEQARHVVQLVRAQRHWEGVEVWRDWPGMLSENAGERVDGVRVRGCGNGRAVVCWTRHGAALLGRRGLDRLIA